jgi:hypothetical protein
MPHVGGAGGERQARPRGLLRKRLAENRTEAECGAEFFYPRGLPRQNKVPRAAAEFREFPCQDTYRFLRGVGTEQHDNRAHPSREKRPSERQRAVRRFDCCRGGGPFFREKQRGAGKTACFHKFITIAKQKGNTDVVS